MKEYNESKWKSIGIWDKQRSPYFKKEPSVEGRLALDWLKKHEVKGTLLDVGCGGGRNSILFSKNGFKVTGIDYSKNAIRLAKILAQEKKEEIAFKNIDFFDYNKIHNVIVDFGCFHHLNNKKRKKYIKHLKKICKNYFLIYTYSTNSKKTFNFDPKSSKVWSYKKGIYNHYYSKEELRKLFSKDFKILKELIIKEEGRLLRFNLTLMQKL